MALSNNSKGQKTLLEKWVRHVLALVLYAYLCLVMGCAVFSGLKSPENPYEEGVFYISEKRSQPIYLPGDDSINDKPNNKPMFRTRFVVDKRCSERPSPLGTMPTHFWADEPIKFPMVTPNTPRFDHQYNDRELPLSPGDLIEVRIHEGKDFSGNYVINHDGGLALPFLPTLHVSGLSVRDIEEKLSVLLIREQIFLAHTLQLSVRTLEWAPIQVTVAGAVFSPGRVLINDRIPSQTHEEMTVVFGDYPAKRYLSEALRSAAGIRPDAKINRIILLRQGWQQEIDMGGVLSGAPVNDVPLIAGDQIIVPTTGCFQPELVRPSQITPKGFRVFMSNLIVPAFNNSSAAISKYASNLPYGSRLLQAAISANCVGGIQSINASRFVVLASKNPITNQIEVVERSVEALMRNPNRDAINPYLLPNDSIACYDSAITNLREIARTITDIIVPFKTVR